MNEIDRYRVATATIVEDIAEERLRGYLLENVLEELREHAEEYPHVAEGLAPLIQGIETRWLRAGELMPIPDLPTVTTSGLEAAQI